MKARHVFRSLFALALFMPMASSVARAENPAKKATFTVTTDQADGVYRAGEPIVFSILMQEDGHAVTGRTLRYTVQGDGLPEQKGQLISAAEPVAVTTKMERAGWIHLKVTGSDAAGKPIPWWTLTGIAGAAVDPFQVKAGQTKPADFDAFWAEQKATLAGVPKNGVETVETITQGTNLFDAVKVRLDIGPGLRPLMAMVTIPHKAARKSLPARLSFPGAGIKSAAFRPMDGTITLAMNVHGIENLQPDAYYLKLRNEVLKDYPREGANSRDTYYFRGVILRILRALDYVKSRPEWDGKNLVVEGGSQGGGLALIAAGLDPDVTQCLAGMPALCDHLGYVRNQFSGWPQLVALDPKTRQPVNPACAQMSGYYDAVNFAARVKAVTVVRIGLRDTTCPPTSVFAAFNSLSTTNKTLWIYPEAGHMLQGRSVEIKPR
jgi:cephalosporin-C deacetylase